MKEDFFIKITKKNLKKEGVIKISPKSSIYVQHLLKKYGWDVNILVPAKHSTKIKGRKNDY